MINIDTPICVYDNNNNNNIPIYWQYESDSSVSTRFVRISLALSSRSFRRRPFITGAADIFRVGAAFY